WALRFRTSEEEGSPAHAWMFYVVLVLFPLWWIATFWRGSSAGRTRRTRRWRCHWMTHRSSSVHFLGASVVASWRLSRLITYVPFIVCVA
ncbi:hypothetical protein V8E53_013556, partial [Lactarius tabidus]